MAASENGSGSRRPSWPLLPGWMREAHSATAAKQHVKPTGRPRLTFSKVVSIHLCHDQMSMKAVPNDGQAMPERDYMSHAQAVTLSSLILAREHGRPRADARPNVSGAPY